MKTLTNEQNSVLKLVKQWYNSDKQEFFLAGYAGTGKSTLINFIIKELNLDYKYVSFTAFTGKAALVLTQKSQGKYLGSTIHRLLYRTGVDAFDNVMFTLRDKKDLSHLRLIVVDEAGMVPDSLYNDLKLFDIKILFVGDHGQLPPVGEGNMVAQRIFNHPDACLNEIHRQAADNPIIYLSMLARKGGMIKPGNYSNKVVVLPRDYNLPEEAFIKSDQVICGLNKTRLSLNNWYRDKLGYKDKLPVIGDKLICLRNDWGKCVKGVNLVNGMIGYVSNVFTPNKSAISQKSVGVDFRPDFMNEDFKNLYVLKAPFLNKKEALKGKEFYLYNDFTYGYTITCHKSQGSQWPKVLVIDESFAFKDNRYRWLYTAITRSEDSLVLKLT